VAIILALILAGSVIVGALASVAGAVSQEEIDELKNQKEQIEQNSQAIESKIDSLEYEQMTVIAKKEILDEKVNVTNELINNLTEQIEVYNGLIADKKVEVEAAQAREDAQYQLYKDRIRAMEENGTISYFEIVFGATSFADLLSRIDFISEIMNYDEGVYDDYVKAKNETLAAKASLEEANALQQAAKREQEIKEAELEEQVAEASALIIELGENIDAFENERAQLQEEEARLEKEIEDKMEALAQQKAAEEAARRAAEEAARNQQSNYVSGGMPDGDGVAYGDFIWPSADSRYVTSLFGTRLHPIYHTYKTHNGIDIGASGGSSVLAADGGTVTTSTYSSSYGNYIIINHGNGTSTLYAHMIQRLVSEGQSVSQGQVIGLVGSTGVSTGNHLHFEVYVGGSRVNPLNYFSNYTISPSA
jgi:murein DD-endopeptidase MepM/ murein hydrolase activator NlpD